MGFVYVYMRVWVSSERRVGPGFAQGCIEGRVAIEYFEEGNLRMQMQQNGKPPSDHTGCINFCVNFSEFNQHRRSPPADIDIGTSISICSCVCDTHFISLLLFLQLL